VKLRTTGFCQAFKNRENLRKKVSSDLCREIYKSVSTISESLTRFELRPRKAKTRWQGESFWNRGASWNQPSWDFLGVFWAGGVVIMLAGFASRHPSNIKKRRSPLCSFIASAELIEQRPTCASRRGERFSRHVCYLDMMNPFPSTLFL